MKPPEEYHRRIAWPELLLVLAIVALILQLFPSLGAIAIRAIDPRNWPRTVWFYGNIGLALTLIGLRFGPELYKDWQVRRARKAIERFRHNKQVELKAKHEMIQRMREAEKRRIY